MNQNVLTQLLCNVLRQILEFCAADKIPWYLINLIKQWSLLMLLCHEAHDSPEPRQRIEISVRAREGKQTTGGHSRAWGTYPTRRR